MTHSTTGSQDTQTDLQPTELSLREEELRVLRKLLTRAASLVSAERILVLLARPDQGSLVSLNVLFGFQSGESESFTTPLGEGLCSDVLNSETPRIVHAPDAEPAVGDPLFAGLNARNAIAIPLIYIDRDEEDNGLAVETPIGVLLALDKVHGEAFDERDVEILLHLGRQAAQIIAYTHLVSIQAVALNLNETIFRSMSTGFFAVNPQGRIFQVNERMAPLGITDKDVGRRFEQALAHHPPFLTQMIQRVMESGKSDLIPQLPVRVETEAVETERVFRVQVDPIRHLKPGVTGRGGAMMMLQDITQLLEEEKMQGSLTAMFSHDLRTPLTSIEGFARTMLMMIDADFLPLEDAREFSTIILHSSLRMKRLVNDVLAVTRLLYGGSIEIAKKPFDLEPCLMEVLDTQKSAGSSQFQWVVDIPPDFPPVNADQERVEQIVGNFLSNAMKYSPDGGTITVKVTQEEGNVRIAVSDQGIGIPKEELGKMFERLHRVSSDKHKGIKGIGLGLYLSKSLAEAHGGHIGVESEYGKGSTFYVELPNEESA